MEVECSFSSLLCRFEPDDFIKHLDLTVIDHTESGERIILGKIVADLLPIADVVNAGERLYDVCDADSAGWEQVYTILFEKGSEFRPELEIEAGVENVLFVWKSLLHPKLDPYRQGIFDTVGGLFTYATVFAMWNHAMHLTDKELAELGFRKIARSELIYRDMTLITAYSKKNPSGTEVRLDFEPTKEDEEWVAQRWNEEERNHIDRQTDA
jgi:hypothetical protein